MTIDIGKLFVTATYDLEGVGPLVLCCYERLQAVTRACTTQPLHLPNLRAVVKDIVEHCPEKNAEQLLLTDGSASSLPLTGFSKSSMLVSRHQLGRSRQRGCLIPSSSSRSLTPMQRASHNCRFFPSLITQASLLTSRKSFLHIALQQMG